jgi:hypothetical protein
MRTSTLLLVVASAFALVPGFTSAAEEEDHSAHHPAPAASAENAPAENTPDALQQGMRRIEDLMFQIRNTDDLERRRTLLAEHLQAMRDQMLLIRTAGRPAKTAAKGTEQKEGGMGMMKGGGMMEKHKKVEQRLDMLERLLQQAVEREAAEESLDQR